MKDYVVSMTQVSKQFGALLVLDKVDFHLKKGEIHSLVGGNGAGKSTMMKIMAGVYTCSSGDVFVEGKKVSIDNPKAAAQYGIRMIYQEMSLIPTMTVIENIFLNNESVKRGILDKKTMARKAKEILDMIGFDIDPYSLIEDCSVGVCQMVEIAKALSVKAKVLIMDEPTASLTEEETSNLFTIMRRLKSQGVSIVYISHRLKEVMEISDHISVLRDGKVAKSAPSSEYTMSSLIESIMGKSAENHFEYKPRTVPVSEDVMLSVQDLSWIGNSHTISFDLYKGEILGIVGLLGSGRTEIMEVLFGLRKSPGAKITLDGKPAEVTNTPQAIESGMALVPEDRRRQGLILMHNLKENLCLPNQKRLKKGIFLSPHKSNCFSEDCVDQFGIVTDSIYKGIQMLSGGNQQKAVIAKWYAGNPKVLMMDEPTAGVDIGAKGEIINLIRGMAENGGSIIFVSSEISEVMAVCDRVIILEDGAIKSQYSRDEISSEETLQYEIQH